MGKMASLLVVVALALAVAAMALVPTGGHAQPVAAGGREKTDAVAAEVRLLRQAVERLAAVTVKSQVLVGRLASQEQRVARELDAIARAEEVIDATGRRQERTRATLERADRALGNVVEEPRAEARREVENLRAELDDQDRELTRLRARLSQAEQSLKSEQRLYAEVDAALTSLVREVESPSR